MQQDELEVTFCDLCGASVPVGDLANQTAIRHQGKVVGACCLAALRGQATGAAGARGATDTKPMLVGIVLLFALASATMFLDHRITGAETTTKAQNAQLAEAQRSDSDVLQAIGTAMDGAARRADLDALGERLLALEGTVSGVRDTAQREAEQTRQDVAVLRDEVRAAAAASVDYRPLFEELRRNSQRQGADVEALARSLRSAIDARGLAVPAAGDTPAAPEPAEAPAGAPQLPGALTAHVAKLQSPDPAVRFEAVDELLRSKEPAVLPHLLPLARDPDSFVRRLTIEGLRDFKKPEAVEALLAGLGDADENVRDTAWRSLREVTGQKLPFEATASKDARARAQQRWQEWWDKNKAGFGS